MDKDMKRKVRDWDNDNHIMKKNGRSIRAKIAEALVKTQRSIITYESLAATQENSLERIPDEEFGHS